MLDLESHPLADRYPLMEEAEFAAFKEDIRVNGCREEIRLYEGKVLDGRHRYRACKELGVEALFRETTFATVQEAAAAVDSWNLHRRHLTAEFRRERVAAMRAAGMSLRKIAAAVGSAVETVRRDLAAGVSFETPQPAPAPPLAPPSTPSSAAPLPPPPALPPAPPKVTGRDGKQYPASRPTTAAKPSPTTTAKPESPPAATQAETDWNAVAQQLAAVAKLIESAPNPSKESKPWELVESLEATARVMVEKAREIRRRFHL